jgi:hypothetical protein
VCRGAGAHTKLARPQLGPPVRRAPAMEYCGKDLCSPQHRQYFL